MRVRAAAINPLEWHQVRGTPYLMRLSEGIGAPKNPRIGRDFAGVVAAVGGKVTRYKVGDEIFGGGYGALSEYILVRENGVIARKPANVSFEQAAGVYVAGITALQALRDGGGIRPGDEVLINGASGGVGTFAVQIARSLGAQVTARNRSFDAILDNVANRSLLEIRRVLKPKGKYLVIGGGDPAANPWIGAFKTPVKAAILSRFIDQDMRFFLSDPNRQDLLTLAQLIATGQARPVVDRRYRL
ncbi:MAG: NAD(P)-dependent alcohol dehydrogenase, partial [Steroidobacteraceae bacterium]|nr:NAD(P)-dependent alcohol dehydrogenase [Steroidobacteraceae bacterium]